MSKTFTCCELIERIKNSASWESWKEEDKYKAIEFLKKASVKTIPDGVNEEGLEKVVYDELFCEKCQKWFSEQQEAYDKILDVWIEKLKSEGKLEEEFLKNSDDIKKGTTMDKVKEMLKEAQNEAKESRDKEVSEKKSRPFWSNPQGKKFS